MTTNFKVGQKVVCVENFNGFYSNGATYIPYNRDPIMGEIYIVDGIRDDAPAIYLKRFDYLNDYGFRVSFAADHFRPLTYSSISATLASTCLKETQIETSDTPIKDPSPKPEKEIAV